MKKLLFIASFLMLCISSVAQEKEETLFDNNGKTRITGFGGPAVKFSCFDGNFAVMPGGYGGVLINSQVMLGGGGFGMANQVTVPTEESNGIKSYWQFGYGGFIAEYIHRSHKMVHFYGGFLIGGGGVSKTNQMYYDASNNDTNYEGSAFFVAEPYFGLEINLFKFMRSTINASYRFISGSSTPGISDADMRAAAFSVGFKFGKF